MQEVISVYPGNMGLIEGMAKNIFEIRAFMHEVRPALYIGKYFNMYIAVHYGS